MKIYNYGNPEKNSLFLLPGSCAHPENYFGGIREYLEKFYNVFRVGYTGFNKTENTDFVSVTDEAEKIENYVKDNLDGKSTASWHAERAQKLPPCFWTGAI